MAHCETSLDQVPGEAYRQKVFLHSLKMNEELDISRGLPTKGSDFAGDVAPNPTSCKLESEE